MKKMNVTLSQKFRIQSLLFFTGIFLSQYLSEPYFPGIFLGITCIFFWMWKFLKYKKTIYIFLTAFGLFWGSIFPFLFPPSIDISRNIGTYMKITGTVISYPEIRRKDIRFYAKVNSYLIPAKAGIQSSQKSYLSRAKPSEEKILMILRRSFKNIQYGDVFTADISPVLPTSMNPSEFDYRKYLFEQDIRVIAKNTRNFIISSEEKGGFWIFRVSQGIRDFFLGNISKHLPKTHTNIAMGMTLGSKSQLPKTQEYWFKDSGLQHILVVSGTNVTLLFFLILYLLAPLGRRVVFICSLFFLVFFVLVAGADPPVLRAAIMGSFLLFANTIGRLPDLRNFLVLAAVILGIFNPILIQKSVSFFLSFVAMSGLVLITPIVYLELKKILGKVVSEKVILFLAATISAQISVFPVIGYYFGSFPLGGILSNILVDPLVPFIMGGTFLTGLFASIPLIGEISGIFLEISISVVLVVAKYFSTFFIFSVSQIVGLFGIIFFLGFFVWAMISKRYEERYWRKFLEVLG